MDCELGCLLLVYVKFDMPD